MKLKVRPEGRPDMFLVSPTDLAEWLDYKLADDQETVHSFAYKPPLMLGADWNRGAFDNHLADDTLWAVIIDQPEALSMPGHNLVHTPDDGTHYSFEFDLGLDDLSVTL